MHEQPISHLSESLMMYDAFQADVTNMVLHYSNVLLFYCFGVIVLLTLVIMFLLRELLKKNKKGE